MSVQCQRPALRRAVRRLAMFMTTSRGLALRERELRQRQREQHDAEHDGGRRREAEILDLVREAVS